MPGRSWPTQTAYDNTSAGTKPYRYGFNGQEGDFEVYNIGGTSYTAAFWQYDSRLGRRWNIDPKGMIGISDYSVNGNNPIYYTDPFGDFRTKFGANVYKFFHGGEVSKATAGEHAGEYFVGKGVAYTGEGAGGEYQRTFSSGLSSAAEYGRGAVGTIGNFFKFALGGGGNQTYKEGSFEADEMATSPGVQSGFNALRRELAKGNSSAEFDFAFSPNPKAVLKDIGNFKNPFGSSISSENVEAHKDAIGDQSWTKLYVGGYAGAKITLINANTVRITIENKTTANSFLLHGGELIFGKENGAKTFNEFFNKTPLLNTLNQRFEFTVPFKK